MTCPCIAASQTQLCIAPGRAFVWTVRPATLTLRFAEITSYSGIAPLYAIAAGHGLTAGWPVSIVDSSGRLPESGPVPADVVDADTLRLDTVGPVPPYTGGFEPYQGGHFLRSFEPLSLAGATATWSIYRGSETLLELDAQVNDVEHTVSILLTPLETQALTFAYARHELRLQPAVGDEISLAHGVLCVGVAALQEPLRDLMIVLSGVGAGSDQATIE